MNNIKVVFDTKKIIISVITLLAGVIFLLANLGYMIALVIFIISLVSIYLYMIKNDRLSIVAFLTIFIVVLVAKFSTHYVIGLVSFGAFVFISGFFIIFNDDSEMMNISKSLIATFILLELFIILGIFQMQLFAKGILISALYLTLAEILKNASQDWDLNSYKYCIIFILVAMPIAIFYI